MSTGGGERVGREGACMVGFLQSADHIFAAGHDNIHSGADACRFIGAVFAGGEPVGHQHSVEAPFLA